MGVYRQFVTWLDLSSLGLVCPQGLPQLPLGALLAVNRLSLADNPGLNGTLPSSWSTLQHLSACPSNASTGVASFDAYFSPNGWFCGLDAGGTGLCGPLPRGASGTNISIAGRTYPASLPSCSNGTASASSTALVLAPGAPGPIGLQQDLQQLLILQGLPSPPPPTISGSYNNSSNATCGPPPAPNVTTIYTYDPFCTFWWGKAVGCMTSSTNVTYPTATNVTICSPPPPVAPPPPPPAAVCIQPSTLTSLEVYLCVPFWYLPRCWVCPPGKYNLF